MDTPGEVSHWLRTRSIQLEDWPLERVLKAKLESTGGSISVVPPALNERETVGAIVSAIRVRLMDEVPLVDELLVVDSGSSDDTRAVAWSAGARVLSRDEILPRVPAHPGKGEVLWRSLLATSNTFVCFIDAALRNFDPAVIPALLGPLLTEPTVQLVKSAHERPLALPGATQVDKGGRVTELGRPSGYEFPATERPPMLSTPEYRYSRLSPRLDGEDGARAGAGVTAAGQPDWLRVGLGPEASRWTTRHHTAKVLFVVHNVTSATRLMDVMPLLDGDLRIARFVTCTGSSPFQAGVADLFTKLGIPSLPWEQAKSVPFDLIVSASYGGELHELRGKLAVLSHGMGYNKVLRRATGDGRRATGDGRRATGDGVRHLGGVAVARGQAYRGLHCAIPSRAALSACRLLPAGCADGGTRRGSLL